MLKLALPGLVVLSLLACSSESKIQGSPTFGDLSNVPELAPTSQSDVIYQVTVPSVDVLYVIDNSGSMELHQNKLANNFPKFMQYFLDSGLDYHIGVTTSDMLTPGPGNQGELFGANGALFVDENTTMPIETFAFMAKRGTMGDSEAESGRAPAYTALELKRNGANSGFVRDTAVQHIIFISDEKDQSGTNPVSKPEFLEWMRNFKDVPENTVAHSIVGPANGLGGIFSGCVATPGGDFLDYARQTGGIEFNICAPSAEWAVFLEELGLQAAGLKREFFLSKTPVPESITLHVTQVDPDSGATVDLTFHQGANGDPALEFVYSRARNSVAFVSFVPEPFAEVEVSYALLEATQVEQTATL